MFDLGPEKILAVLVFAFVIFGPERFPEMARNIGGALRTLRGAQEEMRGHINATLNTDPDTLSEPVASIEAKSGETPGPKQDPTDGGSFI
jgi:TatA/E family protein of Tat protein translocase